MYEILSFLLSKCIHIPCSSSNMSLTLSTDRTQLLLGPLTTTFTPPSSCTTAAIVLSRVQADEDYPYLRVRTLSYHHLSNSNHTSNSGHRTAVVVAMDCSSTIKPAGPQQRQQLNKRATKRIWASIVPAGSVLRAIPGLVQLLRQAVQNGSQISQCWLGRQGLDAVLGTPSPASKAL